MNLVLCTLLGLAYYKKELYGNIVSVFLDAVAKIPENSLVTWDLPIIKRGKR